VEGVTGTVSGTVSGTVMQGRYPGRAALSFSKIRLVL
jgi:hypothetical protein